MQLQHTCLKYMTSLSCVAFLSSTSPSTVVVVVVFSMQNILSTTLYHFLPARAEYIHTISKIPGPILSAASHLSCRRRCRRTYCYTCINFLELSYFFSESLTYWYTCINFFSESLTYWYTCIKFSELSYLFSQNFSLIDTKRTRLTVRISIPLTIYNIHYKYYI